MHEEEQRHERNEWSGGGGGGGSDEGDRFDIDVEDIEDDHGDGSHDGARGENHEGYGEKPINQHSINSAEVAHTRLHAQAQAQGEVSAAILQHQRASV
jgi:hypothetical protein